MERLNPALMRDFLKEGQMKTEKESGLDLGQIRTIEINGKVFLTKFVRSPGLKEIDIKKVGVVWQKTKQWMIFQKDQKNPRRITSTGQRGILGKPHITETRVARDVFVLMRLAARKHFLWHERLKMAVWKDVIYKDLEPPGYRRKKFPPAKNPAGLTQKPPEPDLFTSQETWGDVERALNHRHYHGRKKNHKPRGKGLLRIRLPKGGDEYDLLEDEGQGQLCLDDPLDF